MSDKEIQTRNLALKSATDALAKLGQHRVDSRSDWVTAGMAIHRVLGGHEEGLNLWREWSRQSPKFQEGECERLWAGFRSDKANSVNLGTLKMWAKQDVSGEVVEPASNDVLKSLNAKLLSSQGRSAPAPIRPNFTLNTLIAASAKKAKGSEVGRWFYQDREGTDVLCVVRFQPPAGKKVFAQFSNTEGTWIAKGIETLCPLYRLPKLLRTTVSPVVVCEGEKAADAAHRLGFLATTSCQGAQSAGKTDWSPLAGREVTIFPDNDPKLGPGPTEGEKYAHSVAQRLLALTPPAVVRIVHLPNLPPKGDFFNYEKGGGSKAAVESLIEETAPLARSEILGGAVVEKMEDFTPSEIQWLWKGRIPLEMMSMIIGAQGDGKSFMMADWAARVSRGINWPDGTPCPKGKVLYIEAEDHVSKTMLPRFIAHGADVTQIRRIRLVSKPKLDGGVEKRLFTLADLAALEDFLTETPDCKLVIIDPVGSFLGKDTDSYRDNEVRSVLAPLSELAERFKVAIVVIAHCKKESAGRADNRHLGSVAFTALSRVVWHLFLDKTNPKRRLFSPGKINIGEKAKGMAFTIVDGRVMWEEKPLEQTADDIEIEARRDSATPASVECASWLRHELAGGVREVTDLKREAEAAGLNWRTVTAAARDIVGVVRSRIGTSGGWTFRLPTGDNDASN